MGAEVIPVWLIFLAVGMAVLVIFLIDEARRRRASEPQGMIESYWTGLERRRTVRLSTQLVAHYHVLDPRNKRIASVRNISAGGLQMTLEEKLHPGARLELEIQLEDRHKMFVADGQVAWVSEVSPAHDSTRKFATGIQFINMSPSAEQELMRYIESRLVGSSPAASP